MSLDSNFIIEQYRYFHFEKMKLDLKWTDDILNEFLTTVQKYYNQLDKRELETLRIKFSDALILYEHDRSYERNYNY
jgi:hypothetical protein